MKLFWFFCFFLDSICKEKNLLMMNILLINGPNLNLLGTREPEIYGNKTLSEIEQDLTKAAKSKKILLECFQSNHEGEIVDKIHDSVNRIQGILINAGAFTHTSISIRDALIGSKIPFVELHISCLLYTSPSPRDLARSRMPSSA